MVFASSGLLLASLQRRSKRSCHLCRLTGDLGKLVIRGEFHGWKVITQEGDGG
jgi:hypothetical protein